MINARKTTALDLTWTGVMAAVACVLGPMSIQIPVSPVPVTLTNLVLYIFSCLLGWKQAMTGCFLYLLLGAAGLPVFSGFSGGLAKLAGPTGGYLIGFLFLTACSSAAAEKFPENRFLQVLGMALGTAMAYGFGTVWLGRLMGLSFMEALAIGVLPYLAFDGVKIGIAAALGPVLRKRLRRAGVMQRRGL